jgi:glycine betaine/proline transport system ATP-binding protein
LEALKLGDRVAIMKDGEIVQIGTPQEIVARPVNAYVREFTRDVPRAKVLTAAAVMQPANGAAAEQTVVADTTLEALIPRVLAYDGLLSVVNGAGTVIGTLDRRTVLLALAEG